MGVDTCVFVKKSQFKKLIEEDFDKFLFLIQETNCRWYTFEDKLRIDDEFFVSSVNSKDMIKAVSKCNISREEKEQWIDILLEYDLIFQPDTKEEPKGYVDLWRFYFKMIEFVKKNLEVIRNSIEKQE